MAHESEVPFVEQTVQEDPHAQDEQRQHGQDVEENGKESRESSTTLSDSRSRQTSPVHVPQTVIPLEDAESSQTSAEQSPIDEYAEEVGEQEYEGDTAGGKFSSRSPGYHSFTYNSRRI